MPLTRDGYRRRLDEHAIRFPQETNALTQVMLQRERNVTRFFYANTSRAEQPRTLAALLSLVEADTTCNTKAVCVIENISAGCIETIGSAWDISPAFFATHASNPPQSDLWGWRDWKPSSAPATEQHLDGIYEYHGMKLDVEQLQRDNVNYCKRHIFQHEKWPVNISTRLSYCRPSSKFCEYILSSMPKPYQMTPCARFVSGRRASQSRQCYGQAYLLPAQPNSAFYLFWQLWRCSASCASWLPPVRALCCFDQRLRALLADRIYPREQRRLC